MACACTRAQQVEHEQHGLLHLERRFEWRFARDEKAHSRAISSVVLLIRSAMQLSRDERNGRRKQRTIENSNQSAACAFVIATLSQLSARLALLGSLPLKLGSSPG